MSADLFLFFFLSLSLSLTIFTPSAMISCFSITDDKGIRHLWLSSSCLQRTICTWNIIWLYFCDQKINSFSYRNIVYIYIWPICQQCLRKKKSKFGIGLFYQSKTHLLKWKGQHNFDRIFVLLVVHENGFFAPFLSCILCWLLARSMKHAKLNNDYSKQKQNVAKQTM